MQLDKGGESWEEAGIADSEIDAHLLSGMLEEEGIATHLEVDRSGFGDYLHAGSNPIAPVRIFVPASQLIDAKKLLAEARFEEDESALPEDPIDTLPPTLAGGSGVNWRFLVALLLLALILYGLFEGNPFFKGEL